MRQVEEPYGPVNNSKAQRDEGVNAARYDSVNNKLCQKSPTVINVILSDFSKLLQMACCGFTRNRSVQASLLGSCHR